MQTPSESGTDEYGNFTIVKSGINKKGALWLNVQYTPLGINSNTFWYFNADGSAYKNNPDSSTTYRKADGTVIHTSPTGERHVAMSSIARARREANASLAVYISNLLVCVGPLFVVYPGPVLVTVLIMFVFFLLLTSSFLLFNARNRCFY
ncbi:hypothetical protein DFH11DRAFT_1560600 [Phellopilus nigrolimitatus]|nr:hypothetical protein DFH11DRAFT_1560600 [Phellopilus nigrolimitatus]